MDTRMQLPSERKSSAERIAMSSKRLLILVVGTFLVSCASTLVGQVNIPSARFNPQPVDSYKNTRPLAEPGVFNYDSQVFAPIEFTSNEELEPNTGFYFVYERVYTSLEKGEDRNDTNQVSNDVDYAWGNRFELGWNTKHGDGWGAVYEYAEGSFLSAGRDNIIVNPFLTRTDFNNLEINRMFRQPVSHGGYFEPYVGFRYIGLTDDTIEDVGGNRFLQEASNDVFGGHAGGRYSRRRGRLRTTFDGAVIAGYNRQRYFATDLTSAGGGFTVSETFDDDTSFIPGFDLRAEFAYSVSRDIALRTGFQLIYLVDGVNRADTVTTALNPNSQLSIAPGAGIAGVNDENFSSVGFTFGVEWKR